LSAKKGRSEVEVRKKSWGKSWKIHSSSWRGGLGASFPFPPAKKKAGQHCTVTNTSKFPKHLQTLPNKFAKKRGQGRKEEEKEDEEARFKYLEYSHTRLSTLKA
jgi:hypothetical protein